MLSKMCLLYCIVLLYNVCLFFLFFLTLFVSIYIEWCLRTINGHKRIISVCEEERKKVRKKNKTKTNNPTKKTKIKQQNHTHPQKKPQKPNNTHTKNKTKTKQTDIYRGTHFPFQIFPFSFSEFNKFRFFPFPFLF